LNSNSQALAFRQGQLIIQLIPGYNLDYPQKGFFSKRSAVILNCVESSKRLGNEWNIWLISFDFSKFSESRLMQDLKELPEVLAVQKNHLINPRVTPNDPLFDSQWYHLNNRSPLIDFDSDKAWDLSTGGNTDAGDSIVVCVIDDGIDINHEDLKPNFWVNIHEIPGNQIDDDLNGYIDDRLGWNTYKTNDLFDIGMHGTPVTGLSGAKGNNSIGIAGICWNVKIMFVEGGGDEANASESYAYPLQQRRLYNQSQGQRGAFVVATNTSWGADFGRPEDSPLWCAIYDSLGSVGILNAASTANQNIDVDVEGDLPTTCESEFLITVTSMNDQNVRDPDAAFGKKSIDLGAYGESVYSTFINNSFRNFSGTSAASPQVTGAIALIYSLACSNLSYLAHSDPPQAAREVKRILLNSVRPNATLLNKTVSGGVLNLFQALQLTSPLVLKEIKEHQLLFEWDTAAIFPIYLRYRIKNQISWKDTTIYTYSRI
jgi:subtilisin family serine protease